MKLLLKIATLSLALMTCSAMAQKLSYRTELVSLNKDLVGSNAILVRKVLTRLKAGDYVDSLIIVARTIPTQPLNGNLLVYVDQRLIKKIQLKSTSTQYVLPIRAVNGVDYSRISIMTSAGARVNQVGVKILVETNYPPVPVPPPQPLPPPSLEGKYCAEYSDVVGPAVPENQHLYCVDWSRISSLEYNSNSCASRSGTVQCVRDGHYNRYGQCVFDGPSLQPGLFADGQIIIPNHTNPPRAVKCLN